jgi:hypothetical protein
MASAMNVGMPDAPRLNRSARLEQLRPHQVSVANTSEVESYLDTHADLAGLLETACMMLRNNFGADAELALGVYRDPEQQDEYLGLYLRLDRYERGILDRIMSVIEPLQAQLDSASGHLLVTTDFRQPQGNHVD